MISRSLRWRLLLAATAAILLALGIAWVFMTLLFERHLERRLEADMTRDALSLVGALTLDAGGRARLETEPADPRLRNPAGGYYWQIDTATGALRSRSLWDSVLEVPVSQATDDWRFRRGPGPFGQSLAILERKVVVESDQPPVVVVLAQDTATISSARSEFARELAVFLGVLWIVLSVAAWLQVSVGLRPLARIRSDLAALQDSAGARLSPENLLEVQPLADAINALADVREKDLALARRRASDLAHGLKTPLSALAAQSRRAREAGADVAADGMDRAIAAIGHVVDTELTRMRLARLGQVRGASANVSDVAERLVQVLEHTEKGERLLFSIEVPESLQVNIEEEHVSEMLGALLENATRHARRQVRLSSSAGPGWTCLSVEDDGEGIAPERHEDVVMRGVRLDESVSPGSGLGLAIARELVEAHGGVLQLGRSDLGGLKVTAAFSGG